MSKRVKVCGLLFAVAWWMSGCGGSRESVSINEAKPDAAYLLADKPAEVVGVEELRERSPSGEEVAVEGRIGGSAKPFVDGIAAFTIVDPMVSWCADSEGCPTPWDYCCSDLQGKVAMVKMVDPDGQPVARDARELLGVKELSKVVVRGRARQDERGNVTVLAAKVHVAKD